MFSSNVELSSVVYLFLFHGPPTTEIYTLSLHDALPILARRRSRSRRARAPRAGCVPLRRDAAAHGRAVAGRGHAGGERRRRAAETSRHRRREDAARRSEEHTSELQSLAYLVCRLLLEKK